MMVQHNPYLDVIFRDASALMDRLCAETGEFTNQQFLKAAVQRNRGSYIDFLSAVKAERGEEFVFNAVHHHQAIGNPAGGFYPARRRQNRVGYLRQPDR